MKIFANNIIDITQFQSDHIIIIDVNFTPITTGEDLQVAAAKCFSNMNKHQVANKFHMFALNVSNYISDHEFIIEDEHQSNRDGSLSYYITFYPTDEDGNVRDKYLIFLRLSDHDIKGLSSRSKNYHRDTANKFKRSQDKNQLYMFENIVIDGEMFKGFASALDHVYDMCDRMKDGSYFE